MHGGKRGQRLETGIGSYVRGLAYSESKLFVGNSQGRKISKSTGQPVQEGRFAGARECGVSIFECPNGTIAQAQLKETILLNDYGSEMFDILVLEG